MIAAHPHWTVSQDSVFGEALQMTCTFGINLIFLFFQNPKEEVEEEVVLEEEEEEVVGVLVAAVQLV